MMVRFVVVPLPVTAGEKFNEAAFFFDQMLLARNNVRTFPFYFSAFLSAFRNTTFYLQTQYSGTAGFDEWYPATQEKMKSDELLKRLNSLRVETVHQNPVNLVVRSGPRLHENPIETDQIEFMSTTDHDGNIIWKYNVGEERTEYHIEPLTDWEFASDGMSVFELCHKGMEMVYQILREWDALLSASRTSVPDNSFD